jgi:hypothetical protein
MPILGRSPINGLCKERVVITISEKEAAMIPDLMR